MEENYDRGYDDGRVEGKEEGKAEEQKKLSDKIEKMRADGVSEEFIQKYFGN